MSIEPYISKYLFAKAGKNKIPLSGTFELSPCCNLDCRMCYVRKSKKEVNELGGEKSVDEWIELAKECKSAGMLFLLLTGGEPFMYKDFKKLYTELKKMGFMISINTNGTLIDEETVNWLKKDPPYRMQITLYGGSNKTYEKLCRDSNGFSKTTKSIIMLKEAGIPIKISASMTPYNIHDLEKIYDFGKKNNIYVQATSYMFPPTRRDKNSIGCGDRFTAYDAAKYQVKIEELRLSKEQFKKKASNMRIDCMKSIKKSDQEIERLGVQCRAGKSAFWVNWKGEMTPCGMMNSPVSYPFKDGVINSWYSIIDETNKIRLPKECSNCKNKSICSVCAASIETETGDFEKIPTYICTMTNNIIKETERIYESLLIDDQRSEL